MRVQLSTPLLAAASVGLTTLTLLNAYYKKEQFYPAIVYLTKSNPSLAVFYAQALVLIWLLGKVLNRVLFGQLRAAETEHLTERAWYAVTETCLAFTVFRDDFSPRFVGQFTLLLFAKCFHWLGEDRVDFMERSPVISLLFHARIMGLIGLLSSVDSYFVSHAYFTTLLRGASVQIVFGFEYAILMTIVFHIAIKYVLHTIDLRNAHPWEGKAVYLLYSELVIDLFRCVLYTVFVAVMIRLHTFPLFSIRPFYLTIRALKKAMHDVVMSRRAIHAMNHLFPDATAEELAAGDNVCIICREEMTGGAAKRLPCAHVFHAACLRSWFQRQQTCPTCRSDILSMQPNYGAAGQAAAARAQPPAAAAAAAAPPAQAAAAAGDDAAAQQPHFHHPNVAALFPFIPPGFMPHGPPPPPPPPPQQAQQQQAQAQAATTVQQAQFSPPPFGMMPPPAFGMPPMPPAPSFAGLSDEEVRTMEGTERAAVEARVRTLRNIQTLLDAAVVQLQQYTGILSAITSSPTFATGASASAAGQQEEPEASTSASASAAEPLSPQSPPVDPTAVDELRQRRLQHFENT